MQLYLDVGKNCLFIFCASQLTLNKLDTFSFRTVVPKLVRAVTQIKVTVMSYYPQYFVSLCSDR